MRNDPKNRGKILFFAGFSVLVVIFFGISVNNEGTSKLDKPDTIDSSAIGANSASGSTATDASSGPNSSNIATSQNPQQQPELQSQIDDQQESNLAQSQAQQQGLLPARFACKVNAFRTGENRSIFRFSVSAPNQIPEVWVSVKTETGTTQGSISLNSGIGEHSVSLKNPTNETRPEVKVYSRPIFTEQYEMCSFR